MSSGRCVVAKPGRARPVSAAQVRAYAAKAQEFAEASTSDLDAGRNTAATSPAIHAGINSADAVCGPRPATGPAGEDHAQGLTLVRQAGRDCVALEGVAPRLLTLQTTADDTQNTTPP